MNTNRCVWSAMLLLGTFLACGSDPSAEPEPAISGTDGGTDASSSNPADAATDPTADAGNDAATHARLAEQVVGAGGGTVTASNGVTIEVPAGALTGDVTLTVEEVAAVAAPAGATSVGTTIQLGPEGQTFASPVKVKLPHTGGSLPVVIAHSPHGGGNWTTLTDGAEADGTHVWAYTSSFSWFQPVYYQGSPDTPVVLDNETPVSPKAVALGSSSTEVYLRGTGFRTDTIVTLFKDGVTTATASPVALTPYGLKFTMPAAFSQGIGLITVQAKNPQAAVGDATGMYAIATPVLGDLSPSSRGVTQEYPGAPYQLDPFTVTVSATDLPDNFALCRESLAINVGGGLAAPADTGALTKTQSGFTFVVSDIQVAGTHELTLWCGGVVSNKRSLTFNVVQ